MADYSEFPTTPTAWQEVQPPTGRPWTPLATEDPRSRRAVDLVALVPGVLFIALAHRDGRLGPAARFCADGGWSGSC